MNEMVLAAFIDELSKIAENAISTDPAGVKPAPIPSISKSVNTATKPQTKTTNYSNVNTQAPMAAQGVTSGTKSTPPPPVQM